MPINKGIPVFNMDDFPRFSGHTVLYTSVHHKKKLTTAVHFSLKKRNDLSFNKLLLSYLIIQVLNLPFIKHRSKTDTTMKRQKDMAYNSREEKILSSSNAALAIILLLNDTTASVFQMQPKTDTIYSNSFTPNTLNHENY